MLGQQRWGLEGLILSDGAAPFQAELTMFAEVNPTAGTNSEGDLLHDVADGVATITLNRPALHNALDAGLIRSLGDLVRHLNQDAAIRALTDAADGFLPGPFGRLPMRNNADCQRRVPGRHRHCRSPFAFVNGHGKPWVHERRRHFAASKRISAGAFGSRIT